MSLTLCKHCGERIKDTEDGEWLSADTIAPELCPALAHALPHEPQLREYTEAELAEINRKARVAANWGAGKRLRAQRLQAALQWAKLLAALGFTTLAGYFIGAAHRLC